ncbi:hypothetical protein NIIDMKKI_55600 [Mycobacterium kansasii]|uniref:Nitric oxide reductase subunit B cytochrome c-like domain-containing protein n=1 Tax=Mycobacterium kansasii TaxID=1768 RepID=A0A7G1IIS0_MYCKA|nr:hypothetical protein NIIDMKKI_55600 [Mycobacterium kansasii]
MALVMIFGFLVMGILVYRTYTAAMPMPDKVVTESGQVLFTGDDITRGQELYQARGLMQYGSVLGHGAYLGPDYTADYLRMATDDVADQLRAQGVADPAIGWSPNSGPTATTPIPRRWCSPTARPRRSGGSKTTTRPTSGRTRPSTGCCRS